MDTNGSACARENDFSKMFAHSKKTNYLILHFTSFYFFPFETRKIDFSFLQKTNETNKKKTKKKKSKNEHHIKSKSL